MSAFGFLAKTKFAAIEKKTVLISATPKVFYATSMPCSAKRGHAIYERGYSHSISVKTC